MTQENRPFAVGVVSYSAENEHNALTVLLLNAKDEMDALAKAEEMVKPKVHGMFAPRMALKVKEVGPEFLPRQPAGGGKRTLVICKTEKQYYDLIKSVGDEERPWFMRVTEPEQLYTFRGHDLLFIKSLIGSDKFIVNTGLVAHPYFNHFVSHQASVSFMDELQENGRENNCCDCVFPTNRIE